jgi:ArsR family transcriptional regulator, arsenate/arsenite/antimonite-responsive transcriptional repressor
MDARLQTMERLFQALGDTTRLRILGLLLTGEVCVCHIHESLKVSQPKASRHLAYLRRAGLVDARKEGLWVYYRLADAPDPVVAAVKQAVTHALGHVPGVQRDAQRLQRKNGCCLPVAANPAYACCGASEASPQTTRMQAPPR